MKLLWFAFVVLCAQARADLDANQQGESDVNFHLGSSVLNFNLVAPEHEVTAEDEQLIQELSTREQRSFIADLIKNTLESFRPIVINGNDDIPPLDPFQIDTIGPLYYMVTGVRATAQVNDFRVEGLRWYIVDRVTFNAFRLTLGVHVTIPWITVTGSYNTHAAVLLINHRASGNFRVFINRIDVGVDMRLGTNLIGGHLKLRELDIKIDIHDTFIQITGMTGSSLLNNFISSTVNSLTQDVIQNEMANVSAMLSEELFDSINEILKDYTLADILG
ncbi:uncharacterized protein LOC115445110 [Manduca sexta]|uniref:Uncharacterized protein n=1 Tax=Manduca sexta TaxID=7130 RepID=A0A921Z771_MANSE|nr:uncharacterized protein LOC115445110 [Manduca sexta]KAG6452667.1 hypothetical protein O3G_MSEX007699 [Manduca sexta]KAG6452668.1 hypothetical protein O3G_MSEX007699 [Manduca sexta]